jgi:predicted nucleic acid-binding Zn ribbon protein
MFLSSAQSSAATCIDACQSEKLEKEKWRKGVRRLQIEGLFVILMRWIFFK